MGRKRPAPQTNTPLIIDHDGGTSVHELDGRWFIVPNSIVYGERAAFLSEIEAAIRAGRTLGEFGSREEAESERAFMHMRWLDRKLDL